MRKHIFITGGVVSGLGKGITAASLGRLLKMRGYKVSAQKFDPYMNIDPGTMSPFQHGEVFVTDDGAETDLDLGHYERFMDENLNKFSNLTSGRVYWNVLNKERKGEYLGETVQIIPHVTNEIKEFINRSVENEDVDILITEIGGTIGDIESQPFLETIRQVSLEVGKENCIFIHVTLVPYINGSDEYKSKPTQHSVKELMSIGINPNIIVTRSEGLIGEDIKKKISMFCNVENDCVIENLTAKCLYEVPLMLHKEMLDEVVCRKLGLSGGVIDISSWEKLIEKIENRSKTNRVAIVGKYIKLHDAYLSIVESLSHAGYDFGVEIDIEWIDSETITEETVVELLSKCDGVLVPGGFGERGIEGKIIACKYARENNIPYFGICLGMQVAVIDFARNVCGISNANSAEFNSGGENNIIDLLPEQYNVLLKGGTMRLGSYPCRTKDDSILRRAYGTELIDERHRHRYEFNNDYLEIVKENGLIISGKSPDGNVVEAIENDCNIFHVGVQFHPEFKSRPNRAHPLFLEFVKSIVERKGNK